MKGLHARLLIAGTALFLSACTATTAPEFQETPECSHYRHMMTAPMPPDAMERLRQACEASR